MRDFFGMIPYSEDVRHLAATRFAAGHFTERARVTRMNDVAKNIRKIRSAAGMTQEELAEKMFVTRQTISNWENGKSQPDVETLTKLAELFRIEVTELIYGKRNSYRSFQIKYIIAAAAALCVVLAWIIWEQTWYRPLTQSHTTDFANVFLPGVLYFIVKPLGFMALGVFFLSILSFGIDTRLERRTRILILIVGIVLAVLSLWIAIELILVFLAPQVLPGFIVYSWVYRSAFLKQVFLCGIPFIAGCMLFLGINKRGGRQ